MKDALPISMRDLSVVGYPDYAKAELITITKDPGYIVTKNGWICAYVKGGVDIYVSGVMVAESLTFANTAIGQVAMFPVSKGDVVTCTASSLSGDHVKFIPCK